MKKGDIIFFESIGELRVDSSNDTTLEKSVKAIEWLINHGYISIEN